VAIRGDPVALAVLFIVYSTRTLIAIGSRKRSGKACDCRRMAD